MNPMRFLFRAFILGSCSGLGVAQFDNVLNPQSAQETARREMLRERLRFEQEQRRREDQLMFPFSAAPRGAPLPFQLGYQQGLKNLFPRYEGLPTYPSNVPGYGGYPGAGGETTPGKVPSVLRLPGAKLPVDPGAWPSWIAGGLAKKSERATAQQAVLVRVTDRVWLRPTNEPAYVPLAFYDRFRYLETGSDVEVRGKGEFQVVMHDGGGMRSRGPCSFSVAGFSDKIADLQFRTVENVWVTAKVRPVRVRLPDGSTLEFTASLLHLERRGDRIWAANIGSGPIRYRGSAGNGTLEGPQFVSFWLQPPTDVAAGEPLQLQGRVARSKSGDAVTLTGGDDGKVTWSGASFDIPTGSSVTVEPLKPLPVRK